MNRNIISNKIISANNWHSNDGIKGLQNLAEIVSYLGYKDHARYGQFGNRGACYADIFAFLENNPGAIEIIKDFILDNFSEEEEEEEEEEEDEP